MTKFKDWPDESIDLLVGGTPCQAFSVAGLRKGLDDPRGNLTLTFLALARKYRPRWLVWENVPGVTSSANGEPEGRAPDYVGVEDGQRVVDTAEYVETRALAAFLAGLGELGYGWAFRVLDAQYFGVAQRRRRVFVVANLGDWRRAAAVLFEPESLRGDSPPSREPREGVAGTLSARSEGGGGLGTDFTSKNQRNDFETETLIATRRGGFFDGPTHALKGEGHDASEDGTGRGVPIVAAPITSSFAKHGGRTAGNNGMPDNLVCFDTTQITSKENRCNPQPGDPAHPLAAEAHAPAIAFGAKDYGADAGELAPTLRAGGHTNSHANGGVMPAVAVNMSVRRLTPRECERLQGFPDDYTDITWRGKPAPDGPRYKALGNSMAVPVMAWIGRRIALADTLN